MRGWWIGAQQADFGVMPDITPRAMSGDAPRRAAQADASRREDLEGDAAAALYRPPALRIDGHQAAALLAEAERMDARLSGHSLPADLPVCRPPGANPKCTPPNPSSSAARDVAASVGVGERGWTASSARWAVPGREHGRPGVPSGLPPCVRGAAPDILRYQEMLQQMGPSLRAARRAAGRGHAGGRGAGVCGVRRRHRRGGRR